LKQRLLFWTVLVLLLVLDQLVKAWTRQHIVLEGSWEGRPWPGVFELTNVQNEGIAFGLLQGMGPLLAPVAVAMALLAGFYSYRHPEESWLTHLAMALLAAGALGNLYDRMVLGKVTDMFSFRLIHFPVFNVADACITIAACLMMLSWIVDAVRSKGPTSARVEAPPSDPA